MIKDSPMSDKRHLASIDSLRGVAALMVIFYHLASFAQIPIPPIFSFISTHFGLGVPLFFVLSGFVLSWGYSEKLKFGSQEVIKFYARRFFRIAPLFYLVLVFWRGVGWHLWSWPILDNWREFIVNLTFLFGLVPGSHESLVMAGWSIGVEMLFYFVFPVLIIILCDYRLTAIGFLLSCIVSSLGYDALTEAKLNSYAYMNLVTQLPFFIAGILTFQLWKKNNFSSKERGISLFFIGILMAILAVKSQAIQNLIQKFNFLALDRNIWAIIFSIIIYASCTSRITWLTRGPLLYMGKMSYSMYLLHPIVIITMIKLGIISALINYGIWTGFILGSLLSILLICVVSIFTYRYVERPGIALGKMLSSNAFLRNENAIFSFLQGNALIKHFKAFFTKFRRHISSDLIVKLTTLLVFLTLTYVALDHLYQPLIDIHAFRQTQTAISSYWMLKEPLSFSYQTPIAGYPWSIPFEFPIYQWIVAGFSFLFGLDLSATGRLISYLSLVVCAWPAYLITKKLDLPIIVSWIFCSLLWSSPLYLYWGRAFMIETTALLFTLCSLPYAIELTKGSIGFKSLFFFIGFSVLGILQKSTTEGPLLLFLAFLFPAIFLRNKFLLKRDESFLRLSIQMLAVALILIIGLSWAYYADIVKRENLFGSQLTSAAIQQWNFGTISQRLSYETWSKIILDRVVFINLAGYFGLALLMLPYISRFKKTEHRSYVTACLILFILPLLIFINLHYIHEYYQVSAVAFLIGGIAIVIGSVAPTMTASKYISSILLITFVGINLNNFQKNYWHIISDPIEKSDPRSLQAYKVGKFLKDRTPVNSGIVVFGQDYSSEIAYVAERKSITVPPWFQEYADLWVSPDKYLGDLNLSAMVLCSDDNIFPSASDFRRRSQSESGWQLYLLDHCSILLKIAK